MTAYDLLALTPVTATGASPRLASDNARTALDNAHAELDATTPAADLTTGPTVILDRATLTGLLHLIRGDALDLRNGSALTRTTPLARIIARTDTLLAALGQPADGNTAPDDPDLSANLGAAILRARDLRDTADPDTRDQISTWIEQARAAQGAGDAEQIRRLLATPYVTTGGAR